jgi:hypothetical protein
MPALTEISGVRPSRTARRQVLGLARGFDTLLDGIFYDVGALSKHEIDRLTEHPVDEGLVIVVPPKRARSAIRSLTPAEFVAAELARPTVDAVVIAGVGSTAVGTAALARNVADVIGRPVAGIVSGQGMADVLAEAVGGFFVFGIRNAMRDGIARWLDAIEWKDHVRDPQTHADVIAALAAARLDRDGFVFGSPDSTALLYLLLRLGHRLRLLVGHSKGNYSIENALRGWLAARGNKADLSPATLCVVTLGAVIRFDPAFRNVHQFIGSVDALGHANSRPGLDAARLPGRWHSLNSRLAGAISVREALGEVDLPNSA